MAPHKDLISLLDYAPDEIRALIDNAKTLKRGRLKNDPPVMKQQTAVLIFEKPSLRTRITFETAVHELGGHPVNLEAAMVRMGQRETVDDVARNLQRWVHLIVLRTYAHDTAVRMARNCSVPVINALTDRFHPCQALAFALTLDETLEGAPRANVVFVGDGNNVCASLMVLCAKLGHHFTLACPQGYELPRDLLDRAGDIARRNNASVSVSHDPHTAVARASFIYTDVWTSMGQEDQQEKRTKDFAPFQVNEALLAKAPAQALVSHCLPAHRGEEITDSVLDSKRCRALDEAENRLHVQKAVIVNLLS